MILVAGGAGYIGSHMVKTLISKGFDVIVVDNLSTGYREAVDEKAIFIEGDIGDVFLINKVFTMFPIQIVMHFAAHGLVGESIINPLKYYENNVVKTFNLLKSMITHNVSKIIFSSTCATYGLAEKDILDETAPNHPVNPYGRSKYMVEQLITDFEAAYGLNYVILRYFNVAGADNSAQIGENHIPETHLIPNSLLHLLGRSDHIAVFGDDFPTADGSCIRDYIHVLDLVQAHVLSLQMLLKHHSVKKIYNVGNEKGYSVKQIISICEKIVGKKANIVVKERRKGDPPSLVASSQKIREELGWKATYVLEDMVRSAWLWYTSNPDGYGSSNYGKDI
ncbi:UDP-glucose 4-epimerase GalE [Ectobacillus antri]|uniref:UDP-glucose 4-epimerase n=1 Tax=Ectobacillus antri TaxID=2486280 RepID=A0ABT6H4V4_9BACI|nr:UDP-glucose 4-epimerase GalE [Ectobacillus antri]MDG4656625.1 UDP-glucose 4-epimerase GalE [Ectobacillus antri]MDG5754012.1 UDP-glucose 4-epimerase GalE [Ectobacillus antri]